MRTVKLYWRPRISRKTKDLFLRKTRVFYPKISDKGDYVQLKAPRNDTKYIWLFMLTKMFKDIQ